LGPTDFVGSFNFDKVVVAVGKCGRSRFLAAEASIHTLRISAIKVSDRVMYEDTSKNEDTWCDELSHYDAELYTTQRCSTGGGLESSSYDSPRSTGGTTSAT